MPENRNLPVVKKNNLPDILKKTLPKTKETLRFLALLGASATIIPASFMISPLLLIPSTFGIFYGGQKLYYQSHKDVAFIIEKHKDGNVKIAQDITRLDITAKLKGMSKIDKAAFMQLQAIIGLSKLNRLDRNGEPIQFETDTHSIVQKTFKKLETIGLIQNYHEEPKKQFFNKNKDMYNRLILPKLAFR